MSARRAELRDACARTGLDVPGNDSLHQANPWEYLINTQHHLVWCNVFKAASTSWMYNFNILAGYPPHFLKQTKVRKCSTRLKALRIFLSLILFSLTQFVPLQLARQRYPRPSLETLREALNTSISFLIVRHPLERLLSAYRDKIQYSLPHTLHQRLGSKIIQKYRTKLKVKVSPNCEQNQKGILMFTTFYHFLCYFRACMAVVISQRKDAYHQNVPPSLSLFNTYLMSIKKGNHLTCTGRQLLNFAHHVIYIWKL